MCKYFFSVGGPSSAEVPQAQEGHNGDLGGTGLMVRMQRQLGVSCLPSRQRRWDTEPLRVVINVTC